MRLPKKTPSQRLLPPAKQFFLDSFGQVQLLLLNRRSRKAKVQLLLKGRPSVGRSDGTKGLSTGQQVKPAKLRKYIT